MEKKHYSSEKKASKSFNGQATQPKFTKKVEPLTRNFWSRLMKLETDFYNKNFTASTLDELTQCYARAVEYYDTIKDEITSYFIFKIQDALATKKSLKLLIEETSKASEKKNNSFILNSSVADSSKKNIGKVLSEEKDLNNQIIEEHVNEESSGEDENIDEEDPAVKEFAKKKKAYLKQRNKKAKASFSTMITQKQRFVHFFHKMENQKVSQKQDMHALINEFNNYSKENDDMIQEGLSKQKERLRSLVEQRKQKSFMVQTSNSNSFYANNRSVLNFNDVFSKKDMSETNVLDDVLSEFEDPDLTQFSASETLEVRLANSNEETVLREKINKAKETLSTISPNAQSYCLENTAKTNTLFQGSNSENISPIKKTLECSTVVSTAECDRRSRVEDDSENLTPTKVTKALHTQYEKISSEDVKDNTS